MSAPKWKLTAAFITLCVVWSSTWLAIKLGLGDLPPISFAGLRFLIAFVVLILVSLGRVSLLPKSSGDWLLIIVTGLFMFALNYGLLFWGELHISSGLAALLQATIPVTGMFFAHWFIPEEPLHWQQLTGATVAIGGVALICGRLLFGQNGILPFESGLGIALGGTLAAFSTVLLKRRRLQLAPAMIAAWQMIIGAAVLLSLGIFLEGNPLRFHWSPLAIGCLLYLAVIGSALTFILLYWLLPRMAVNKLQTISLITPPGAVMLGWLIGGERFSLWSLMGGALVLAGVWMIFRKPLVRPVVVPES